MIKIYCSPRASQSAKKSKHRVSKCCDAVKKVLANNPTYGITVSRFSRFRKMRVNVPHANLGKRGGYRLVYEVQEIDELPHILLSEIFYKGNIADLEDEDYAKLETESDEVFKDPLDIEWEEISKPKN